MTNRGLYPVLRTRPDHTPPQICLPSTFWVWGIPVPRIRSGAGSTHAFASVGLGMDFVGYLCRNTLHHQLAAGPGRHPTNCIQTDFTRRSALGELTCESAQTPFAGCAAAHNIYIFMSYLISLSTLKGHGKSNVTTQVDRL